MNHNYALLIFKIKSNISKSFGDNEIEYGFLDFHFYCKSDNACYKNLNIMKLK